MRPHCTTALAALARWLTPQVWKEAHRAAGRRRSKRWDLHPLVMVLVVMTWTAGDSEAERFASARAFYVARHQRQQRPGESLAGFQKALAQSPLPVLHALFAAVRRLVASRWGRDWSSGGFVAVACDGSRQQCPRSAALEKRLGCCGKKDSAPMLYLTSLVLLPAGLLWSWCVGPGTASEHDQLRQLLPTLPRCALLVGDACFLGYDLFTDSGAAGADFLVRVSSRAYLYTDGRRRLRRYRQGPVYYWPGPARKQGRPPLRLRLIRVAGRKGRDVWLLTSVLESTRLSRRQAAEVYRWRWRAEGVYRTYKRTLPKLKLWGRTEALVYREAEVSLLALQLLLLQGVKRQRVGSAVVLVSGSPRQALLQLRGEITVALGAELGPRQRRWYRERLQRVRAGGPGKKVRRKWPRRKDHKPPKPPKVRVIPRPLKAKLRRYFDVA